MLKIEFLFILLLSLTSIAGFATAKKADKSLMLKKLTPMQYEVTQKNATEPAFHNAYWDNKAEGIYVDVVSGEPLFSSVDKYDSKTGWPSFTRPIESNNILYLTQRNWLLIKQTEVRSKQGNSHLGHVFHDGPPPTGLRYCINSAALRFIPKSELKAQGYGKYLTLFEKNDNKEEKKKP